MNKFSYRRFDPSNTKIDEVAKVFSDRYGTKGDLSLGNKFLEVIRLRISLINECNYCTIIHTQRSREYGVSETKISAVISYYECELFTDKELVALEYADALNSGKEALVKQAFINLQEHFTTEEIDEIIGTVLNMIFFVRFKLATGQVAVAE